MTALGLGKILRDSWIGLCHRPLEAILAAFCAGDPDLLRYIEIETLAEQIEADLAELSTLHFYGITFGLLLIEFAIPPVSLKFRPMSWLSGEQRDLYLAGWAESRFTFKRMCLFGLKYLSMKRLYSDPRILEMIGYGPALAERTGGRCKSMARP